MIFFRRAEKKTEDHDAAETPNETCHNCAYFESDVFCQICHHGGKPHSVGCDGVRKCENFRKGEFNRHKKEPDFFD